MKENVSLHVIKTEKFQHMLLCTLFYFGRAFVTSYGWGGSQMYVSAKDDECSDYFSQPYMHVLLSLFFLFPIVPSLMFLSEAVPRQIHSGSHQTCLE